MYRARRNEIAAAALAWSPGEPAPVIDYTDAEHDVWRTVWREITPKHERLAIREFNEAVAARRRCRATACPASTRSQTAWSR